MRVLSALIVAISASVAYAHAPSDSYLSFAPSDAGPKATWDLSIKDLHRELLLDADGNGAITFQEVTTADARLRAFAAKGLLLTTGGADCPLSFTSPLSIVRHAGGSYARLSGEGLCATNGTVTVSYSAFFAADPLHRAIVRAGVGSDAKSFVLTDSARQLTVDLAKPNAFSHFSAVVASGAEHIFSGLDHLLFLFALLLPSVLRRSKAGEWEAAPGIRFVFVDVLRIVSAFTLAHSLTLSASAVGLLALPSRWVESAIAISVVFAALNNVFPIVREGRWMAAFALGLLHGFGFSSSLAETGLAGGGLWVTLLGFNLGVELGQLCCVALFLPVAFALRGSFFYRRVLLVGGSVAILLVASNWFAERAFDLSFTRSQSPEQELHKS